MNSRSFRLIPAFLILLLAVALLVFRPGQSSGGSRLVRLYTRGQWRRLAQAAPRLPRNTTATDAYAVGRAFYQLHKWKQAVSWLKKCLAQPSFAPAHDYVHYYLGHAQLHLKHKQRAYTHFAHITRRHRNSIFYREAVRQAARLAYALKNHTRAETHCKQGLGFSSGYRKAALLWDLARIRLRRKDHAGAARNLFRILELELYGTTHVRALTMLDEKIPRRQWPQGFSHRITWLRALVRGRREHKARRLAQTLLRSHRAPHQVFEIRLNLAWIQRRQREATRAEKSLRKLLTQFGSDRKRSGRILDNLFYLETGRANWQQALYWARRRFRNDKQAALPLFRTLAAQRKVGQSWFRSINWAGLRRYPGQHVFQKNLFRSLSFAYLKRRYRDVLRFGKRLLPLLKSPQLRSGTHFFMGRAYQKRKATGQAARSLTLAVTADPLGYYHYLIRNSGSRVHMQRSPAGKSVQALCKQIFVLAPSRQKAMQKRIRALWPRSPLARLCGQRRNGIDGLLPGNRSGLHFFTRQGLIREAYKEAMNQLVLQGKSLQERPPHAVLWLARLCARGGVWDAALWCYRQLLEQLGWGNELAVVGRLGLPTPMGEFFPRPWNKQVQASARRYRIDPLLVFALMRQESAFNPTAGSWAGARGLMQLMPSTARSVARQLGISNPDLQDPLTSIRIGSRFFGWLQRTFRKKSLALAGYNAGPNMIYRWRREYRRRFGKLNYEGLIEYIPYRETRAYVKKVLSNYLVYRYLY